MLSNKFVRYLFALSMLVTFGFSSFISARPLVRNPFIQDEEKHPLPQVNWIRSRDIDIKNVLIDLRFDWAKESTYGSTTVTLSPFALSNKVSLDAASMTIKSVTLANGTPLKFNYNEKAENDNLQIFLDKFYKRGEDISVKVEYSTNYVNTADSDTAIGSFGKGLRFIKPTADEPNKPKQIWSQGETEFNRYWFPSYDTPNDFRTSELRATVEKPFIVVSNGKLISTTENADGTRTFDWKMDTPYSNYLTSIVVGEFTPVEQSYEGIPVLNFGYRSETKEVAATVKNLPDMIKFFSEKTGVKYPYPKYSQAMVEDFGGGMENISATTQIEEMIHDERELVDDDSDSLQAHELAHQWFGDYVTCRDWGQIWLNESFATYMDDLYNEYKKGHEEFLYGNIRDNQNQYFNTWNGGNRRPIVTKYYANKDAMFDSYAYPRGAAVLHMLRKHLGDDLFWKSLNHYLTTNAHQPVSTEDLRIAIEETTGQSMDWFFDEWLYRMGHPIFDVTESYDAAGKKLTLNVKQTQKLDPNYEFPQVEFFQSYVDVEIDDRIERVWLKPQAENVFTFDSSAKPKLVNFDFESTLIKQITFKKTIDELIFQMLNDKDVLGKRWAMAELEAMAAEPANKKKVVDALTISMEKDKFWRIRRAALSVVANIYSPDPAPGADRPAAKIDQPVIEALLRMAKDPNNLVKGDTLELLGETQDAKYADLFISNLNDQSYEVIDQSALALGRVKGLKAFEALEKLTKASSWHGRIESAGLRGLAELEDKRAFDAAFRLANDPTKPSAVRLSPLEVVGSTGKGDPRAFPLIFERFKKALDTNDFNDLVQSLQAIISIADPRGQEAFDMMRAKFKDQPNLLGGVNFFEQQFKAALKK